MKKDIDLTKDDVYKTLTEKDFFPEIKPVSF